MVSHLHHGLTLEMKPNGNYVSEFEGFMNRFLDEHPEVQDDQRRGRLIHWDHKVDLAAQEKAARDSVPDDGYGFRYSAWPHGRADRAPGANGGRA